MKKLFRKYIQSFDIDKSADYAAFINCISDILESEKVQKLLDYTHHQSVDRLQHVTSVAYISYLLCRRLNLDYNAAARGAMLHDLFYYGRFDSEKIRFHYFRHPSAALENARNIFSLIKKEENIIKRHMWPITLLPPASREALIVCLVDKYCATLEAYYSFFPHRFIKTRRYIHANI